MSESITKTLLRSKRWGKSGYWRNRSYATIQLRKKELRRSVSVADNISVWRMSQELEGDKSSNRNSEIEERDTFLELLCKVQDNRYENQRYVLKTGSDSRSDGDEHEDQKQSLEQGRRTSDIIPINGTLPNGGLTTSPLPGILVSPTTDGPVSISNGSAKCNGVIGEGESVGEGGSESGGCDVGRESLSPPPLLPQSSLTPSRRSMEALKKVIADNGPYPLVIEPPDGGYWIQNGEYESAQGEDGVWRAPEISTDHYRIDVDKIALLYARHFVAKEHRNYVARDSKVGPLLFSIKFEEDYQGKSVRMMLRTQKETIHRSIPLVQIPNEISDPEDYMKYLYLLTYDEELNIERAIRIYYPKAPELIKKFDEQSVAKTHKFGVIYQSFGQTSEEELFDNVEHPPALEEFLELLGDTVRLKGFTGYRGGLDVVNDQTGEYSVYTEYKDREIMFHVSTLLPHDPSDSQHVQRKRHIGNDIVLIVFQDENTPFCPNTVRSHFVHSCIVVQVEHPNTDHTVYKVAVAAKESIPNFGPPLPIPALFQKGPEFRDWLLTKVLNAEFSSHQAPDFLRLANRTRAQLFLHLVEDLAKAMEDVDYPSIPKHFLLSADSGSSPSPRASRRRKTLGSIFARKESLSITRPSFSKRKSIGGSPRTFRKMFESSTETPAEMLIGSTPDLSFITESPASVRSLSLVDTNRTDPPLSPDDAQKNGSSNKSKVKRRFTFRKEKEKKKVKRTVSVTGGSFGAADFVNKKRKPFNSPRSLRSQRSLKQDSSAEEVSSIASGMNWSIPCDLPGVVEASSRRGKGRASLDSLTLNGYANHCQSSPSITERRENEDLISDVRVSRNGPLTVDVAVQVGPVFKFPSPDSSMSPTSPHSTTTTTERTHSPSGTKLRAQRKPLTSQEVQRKYEQHSSKLSSDQASQTKGTRSHHHHHYYRKGDSRKIFHAPSSPSLLVSSPSEESATLPRPLSSQDGQSYNYEEDLRPDERVVYRAESTDSVSCEVDEMYDSLLQSLNALTVEVTRLRQNNLVLATENAKFASQNRTVKVKYQEMKQQLSQAQQQINTLQLKLRLYQPNFPEKDQ